MLLLPQSHWLTLSVEYETDALSQSKQFVYDDNCFIGTVFEYATNIGSFDVWLD